MGAYGVNGGSMGPQAPPSPPPPRLRHCSISLEVDGRLRRFDAVWGEAISNKTPLGFRRFSSLARGARCSSVVRAFAHGTMGRRIDPSWWTHWSYFSFQPVLHNWCTKRPWYVLSCLWDDAYKRTVAANRLCGGSGFPLSLSEWSFTICHNAI